jgi:hypothetical protein
MIYLAAQAQTREVNQDRDGKQGDGGGCNNRDQNNRGWIDRIYKLWSWVAGKQPVGETGLSFEIELAVLKEIAKKSYAPRQEAKPVPQNQVDGLSSKSSSKLRSIKPSLEVKKPSKIRQISPRTLSPAAIKKRDCFASKRRTHEIGNAL